MSRERPETRDTRASGLGLRLDGLGLVLDTAGFQRTPIAAQRQLVDDGEEPGDRSINGQGSWKRTAWSFDHGAGQPWWDEDDEADRRQYYQSVGLDPWTRRELKLHHATEQLDTESIVKLVSVGIGIYVLYANGNLVFEWDPSGVWGAAVIDTDVVDVVYDGVFGYWATPAGVVRSTAWTNTTDCRLLMISGGRLLGIQTSGELIEIAGGGGVTVIENAPVGYEWGGIIDMGGETYSWATPTSALAPDLTRRSILYRHPVSDVDGSLFPGDPVLELPVGELITAGLGFSNAMVLGTNKGLRFVQATSGDNLAHGGLVAIDNAEGMDAQVVALCTEGQYVWFTWTNFADGKSGLGRLDMDEFIEVGVPAYATDLYAEIVYETGITQVTCCLSKNGLRYFGGTFGAYGEVTTHVDSGWMTSGWINFSSPEHKAVLGLDLRSLPLPVGATIRGTVLTTLGQEQEYGAATLDADGGIVTSGSIGSPGDSITAEEMQVKVVMTVGTDTTLTPTLRRWTFRTLPLPFRAEEIVLPVIIQETVSENGTNLRMDPDEVQDQLRELYRSRRLVRLDLGDESMMVYVDGLSIERDSSVTKVRGWSRRRSSLVGVWAVTVITTDVPVRELRRTADSQGALT